MMDVDNDSSVDDSVDVSFDAAATMAEAMGFSSFGAQKPSKRRKFNPSTDAVVAGPASTSNIPVRRSNPTTTGSNMTPLGVRKQNANEIELDDDDEDVDTAAAEGQSSGVDQAGGNADEEADDDPGPQYIDTSRPSTIDNVQSKIDAIVGDSVPSNLPPRPPVPADGGMFSGHGARGGRHRNRGRGEGSGKVWWEDYYDPTFITNPWEKLEKSMGLEPRGPWLSWEEAKAAQPEAS
ncbi:hypothetical protein F5Y16DRAFT_166207 [Xylariaceae sp. FL0255]|nr:hypothetical protein F5Y16DRAFT_166207 [Xylariaceae sp. FL0255]